MSDPNYYHYKWYRLADYMKNETSDSYLQRNVPIPSALFGDNVLLERNLMAVWRVDWKHDYTRNVGSPVEDHKTLYYYGNKPFTKGSTLNYTNIEGITYGLCQQWRMPFDYFPWFHNEVMDLEGFPQPYDPNSGWGWDVGSHQKSSSYITKETYEITITPIYFYSCQKDKLTQMVNFPTT